jgi:hypothetical protein
VSRPQPPEGPLLGKGERNGFCADPPSRVWRNSFWQGACILGLRSSPGQFVSQRAPIEANFLLVIDFEVPPEALSTGERAPTCAASARWAGERSLSSSANPIHSTASWEKREVLLVLFLIKLTSADRSPWSAFGVRALKALAVGARFGAAVSTGETTGALTAGSIALSRKTNSVSKKRDPLRLRN